MERALRIFIKTAVALVLLTPLVVNARLLPDTYFPFIVGKALYARTLTEIAFFAWVALTFRYPKYRPSSSRLLTILAAYVVVVFVSSVFGVSPERSIWSTYERMQGFVDITHWFAYVLVLTSVFRSWADWKALLNANLGVSVFLGVLGLAELMEIWEVNPLDPEQRLKITLGNPTYVGGYMMVNVLVAAGFLARSLLQPAVQPVARPKQRRRARAARREESQLVVAPEALWRAFWIAVIVLDTLILYASGTRAALIGLGAGLFGFAAGYVLWGSLRHVRFMAMGLVWSVAALVLLLALVRGTSVYDRLAGSDLMLSRIAIVGAGDASLQGRINTARTGIEGFLDRPLLGWGPENFSIANDRHLTAEMVALSVVSFDQAHNKLIEELTTKGILGFAAYMAIWVYMLWVIARRVRRQEPHDQVFTLFAGAALLAYFAQNLFLFDTPGTVAQLYLLLGFVVHLEVAPRVGVPLAPDVRRAADGLEEAVSEAPALLRSDGAFAGALAGAGLLAVLAVFFLNVGPYQGARATIRALSPISPWDERLDQYERAFSAAPSLANYPRVEMFVRVANGWDELSPEQAERALLIVEREGLAGTRAEPEDWRVHLFLARVYQMANRLDSRYLPEARRLVQRSVELAPERIEVIQMRVIQNFLEGRADLALEAIEVYLKKNPEAVRYLGGLRQEISESLDQ